MYYIMPTKKRKPKTKTKRKPQRGRGRKTDIAKKGLKYATLAGLGFLAYRGALTGYDIGRLAYGAHTSPNNFIKQ